MSIVDEYTPKELEAVMSWLETRVRNAHSERYAERLRRALDQVTRKPGTRNAHITDPLI